MSLIGWLAADTAAAQIETGRAGEWLTFLAGALDLRGTTAVVFDLPPGCDNVHQHVFDKYTIAPTGVVHVTTGNPLAYRTEVVHGDGMPQRDTTPRWLVENLSRARGPVTGGAGTEAEIRLYGTSDQPVRDLAAQLRITYTGSLSWQPDPPLLAGAPGDPHPGLRLTERTAALGLEDTYGGRPRGASRNASRKVPRSRRVP